MITRYQLHVDELSIELLNSIKSAFINKTIEIIVSEAPDETKYLLSSAANKAHITQSIKELNEGNIVEYTFEELQEKYGSK